MGGQPFEGLGYLGYDNIRGEYTAVWLDNMNTGITRASGQFDPVTKKYTESGTFSCPMTGEKDMPFRGEWKVIDNDTLSYTMYNPGPDGKEMKGDGNQLQSSEVDPKKKETPMSVKAIPCPMLWSQTSPMNEKIQFIADCLRGTLSMAELCDHYGVSRKTGYGSIGI